MKPLLTKFSTTKLTRKEFLTYLGVLTLGILGISSILKSLTEINPRQSKLAMKQTNSFGQGAYGA